MLSSYALSFLSPSLSSLSEDVRWFSPVEVWTKYGRMGRIKEPLGTHGLMECRFDGKIAGHDTVCMNLYKRYVRALNNNNNEQSHAPQGPNHALLSLSLSLSPHRVYPKWATTTLLSEVPSAYRPKSATSLATAGGASALAAEALADLTPCTADKQQQLPCLKEEEEEVDYIFSINNRT